MPSSLSNRLPTGPSHPGWQGYRIPQVGTFCAACDGRLVTPARAHLLVQNAAAHGKKQGEDVDPASDACAEGGTGRPHRREGSVHVLPRQPPTAVGARAACACQMSRKRTNGTQTRGTEENGLGVSARGPAERRALSLKVIHEGLPRPAASSERQARWKAQGVEASSRRRGRAATVGQIQIISCACARRRLNSDTGRYGMMLTQH